MRHRIFYNENRNVSKPLYDRFSKAHYRDVEYVYDPEHSWYVSADSVERTLKAHGYMYSRCVCSGWIYNPCLYVKGIRTDREGDWWFVAITDKAQSRTFIYYIKKEN